MSKLLKIEGQWVVGVVDKEDDIEQAITLTEEEAEKINNVFTILEIITA